MNTLLYLSFGKGRHQGEVAYALATLARFSRRQVVGENGRILLLTDTPDQFTHLPGMVELQPVTQAQLAEWRAGGHLFRTRIVAMRHALSRFGGKLIAVDGDTCFLRPPARLFDRIGPGTTLMYEPECPFADTAIPEYRQTAEVLERMKAIDLGGLRLVPCSARSMQWNAGVLGLCDADGQSLEDVLRVVDVLHPLLPGVWSTEQTAFSLVWQAFSRIRPACSWMFHYNAHPERAAFAASLPALLDGTGSLSETQRAHVLYERRLKRPLGREIRHLVKRPLVAAGLWSSAMRLKARLTGAGVRVSTAAASAT